MTGYAFLDDDDVLIVNRTLAKAIGLNRSIVLKQVRYWLEINRKAKSEKHLHDGSWWTYNTSAEWQENNFDFWSEDTVYRALTGLRDDLALIVSSDKYNEKAYDRTLWYTIHYGNYAAFMRLWHDCAQPRAGDGRQTEDYKLFLELWKQQRTALAYPVQQGDLPTLTASCGSREPQVAVVENRKLRTPIPETIQETTTTTTPPAGDDSRPTIFTLYEQNIGLLTPMAADSLKDMAAEFPADWIPEAFKIAVEANARKLNYVRGVLDRWKRDGRGAPSTHGKADPLAGLTIITNDPAVTP